MDMLETLAAKDEIRELTARYCHAVVDGDADQIVSLFCEDGVFRSHTLAPQGHAALLEFYRVVAAAGAGADPRLAELQDTFVFVSIAISAGSSTVGMADKFCRVFDIDVWARKWTAAGVAVYFLCDALSRGIAVAMVVVTQGELTLKGEHTAMIALNGAPITGSPLQFAVRPAGPVAAKSYLLAPPMPPRRRSKSTPPC